MMTETGNASAARIRDGVYDDTEPIVFVRLMLTEQLGGDDELGLRAYERFADLTAKLMEAFGEEEVCTHTKEGVAAIVAHHAQQHWTRETFA